MKLWILQPVYDHPDNLWICAGGATGFVIRADTEHLARSMARCSDGDAWLSDDRTMCVELPTDGEPVVVMRQEYEG